MLPDPVSLALFVQAVESGSISRAAELMHLALGAASRRLTQLEQQYNVRLLERTSRGVIPTAAGKALLSQARQSLNQLQKLHIDMCDFARGTSGHLRVQANMSALAQFLPEDLAAFARAHPSVRLDLEERTSAEIIEAVRDGATDIGVIIERPADLELQLYPYRTDRLVVIASMDTHFLQRSLRFEDVLDHDFVALEANTALTQRMSLSALAANKPLRLRVQVRSFEAVIRMVEGGLGIGVLPEGVVAPYARDGRIRMIPLAEPWARRSINICVRDIDALPHVGRMLVELMTHKSFA